jgi:Fe-S-cluster-containing dehydrogenase component
VIENSPDFFPVYCHHCANAPCQASCPVDAITRNEQGIVLIDKELCIGCKECLEACPFGAMQYDDEQDLAMKCDLCFDRLQADEAPACSSVCPTGCIIWGDATTLTTKIVKNATHGKA